MAVRNTTRAAAELLTFRSALYTRATLTAPLALSAYSCFYEAKGAYRTCGLSA